MKVTFSNTSCFFKKLFVLHKVYNAGFLHTCSSYFVFAECSSAFALVIEKLKMAGAHSELSLYRAFHFYTKVKFLYEGWWFLETTCFCMKNLKRSFILSWKFFQFASSGSNHFFSRKWKWKRWGQQRFCCTCCPSLERRLDFCQQSNLSLWSSGSKYFSSKQKKPF